MWRLGRCLQVLWTCRGRSIKRQSGEVTPCAANMATRRCLLDRPYRRHKMILSKETALWFAVVGGLAVGVGAAFVSSRTEAKSMKFGDQVVSLIESTRTMTANDPDLGAGAISGARYCTIRKNVPSDMCLGPALVHVYGGSLSVTGASSTFTVVAASVAREGCAAAIPKIAAQPGIVSVQVGSSGARPTPISSEVADTDCAAAGATTLTIVANR
ncbi:hypothetical protein GE253_23125 [Niveispirillum sp. SYP-B3756]|nr:hypothetical protein [Niveispirillum sp. SYP-B3756]